MATAIVAGTLTALKSSLANAAHGWVTLAVDQIQESVGIDSGNTARDILTVRLKPTALRAGSGTTEDLIYRAIKHDGTLAYQTVAWGGATLTVSDSALNTTMETKAATFLAAQDAGLKAMIDAGAVAMIPADLLAALIASLGDADHGWTVLSRSVTPTATGATLIVSMSTLDVKVPPQFGDVLIPTQLAYLADLTASGALLSARVILAANEWVSTSTSLHSAVTTLGNAYASARASEVTDALEAGPA